MFLGYEEFKRYIQANLKRNQESTNADRHDFESYIRGYITLNSCIDRFIRNNDLTENIESRYFKQWLSELGYKEVERYED